MRKQEVTPFIHPAERQNATGQSGSNVEPWVTLICDWQVRNSDRYVRKRKTPSLSDQQHS